MLKRNLLPSISITAAPSDSASSSALCKSKHRVSPHYVIPVLGNSLGQFSLGCIGHGNTVTHIKSLVFAGPLDSVDHLSCIAATNQFRGQLAVQVTAI